MPWRVSRKSKRVYKIKSRSRRSSSRSTRKTYKTKTAAKRALKHK